MLTVLQTIKFRPGVEVFYRTAGTNRFDEGPYLIESVQGTAKYTLCFADGKKARNGEVVDEKDLKESDDE